MSTRPTSGPGASRRDRFILGVQLAAALMMAQQIAGKAARDGLFLLNWGPRALPGMIAGAAVFSVALSLLSGRLMRRYSPRRVVPWALVLSGILQAVEGRLLGWKPGFASVVIYLHMAGVGAVLLSGFWSLLNEEFDPREAKRKFGGIAAGGTAGGLAGGLIAERAVAWSGAPALMLILAVLHVACGIFLTLLMRTAESPSAPSDPRETPPAAAPHKSPLLVTLGTIVLLGSTGAALLDYVFKVYATESWGRGHDLLRYFAFYHAGVALLSFLLQSAGSKFALEKLGLGKTILTLPATLAGGSFLALLVPGVLVASLARAAEAVVRGSLFRAGYETCYTPVPAAEKRLAKNFIDVSSERGGDALGAGIVYLCLLLAGATALPWILTIAALVGLASVVLCGTLDRIYLKTLARNLESRAVRLNVEADLDLTTRSLVMRAPNIRPGGIAAWKSPGAFAGEEAVERMRQDPVLQKLNALRSPDPGEVHAALTICDVSDPLIAAQVCLLLGQDEYALPAHGALFRSAGRVLGLMTDLMLDPTVELRARRRIPRIIGSVPGQRSADALIAGLEDTRFEVRMQCARSLAKMASQRPRPVIPADKIMAAVDRELTVGRVLWENHRQQQLDAAESGTEWLDELLRDKAHGSLEYVFALLAMLHDRTPLMAAFRSLHLEDRHLRGTALEYLEGLLPLKTRELLWEILEERPSQSAGKAKSEIMEDLLNSSETVMLRLRDKRS